MIFVRIIAVILISISLSACFPNIQSDGSKKAESLYKKGVLVEGFPTLPYYEKSKIVESFAFEKKYGASYVSNDELLKVVEFYNASLKGLGWDFTQKKISDTNYVFEVKNKDHQGVVIVNRAADGKKTAITYSVEAR